MAAVARAEGARAAARVAEGWAVAGWVERLVGRGARARWREAAALACPGEVLESTMTKLDALRASTAAAGRGPLGRKAESGRGLQPKEAV